MIFFFKVCEIDEITVGSVCVGGRLMANIFSSLFAMLQTRAQKTKSSHSKRCDSDAATLYSAHYLNTKSIFLFTALKNSLIQLMLPRVDRGGSYVDTSRTK